MVAAMQQQMHNIQAMAMMQSPQPQPQCSITSLPAPSYGGKPASSGGKNDYRRTPPPPTYETQSASSPYPSAPPVRSRSINVSSTVRSHDVCSSDVWPRVTCRQWRN
eukprot:scaffold6861_cov120-Isochrysis_galbana.AAC.3